MIIPKINKISDVRSPLNRVINDADKNMRISNTVLIFKLNSSFEKIISERTKGNNLAT